MLGETVKKLISHRSTPQVSYVCSLKKSKCFYCKKLGHVKRVCRVRKRQLGLNKTKLQVFVVNRAELIKLKGTVNNSTSLEFIIDTGAGVSLIDSKFINDKRRITKISYIQVKSATGNNLWILGKINLDFLINHTKFRHQFLVVKNLSADAILGNDFNHLHRTDINFVSQTIKYNIDNVTKSFHFATNDKIAKTQPNTEADDKVRNKYETVLKARCTTMVDIKCRGHNDDVNKSFVPRTYLFRNRYLRICHALSRKGSDVVCITNFGDKDVVIFAHTYLGDLVDSGEEIGSANEIADDARGDAQVNVVCDVQAFDDACKQFNIGSNLSEYEKRRLTELLNKYSDVFAWSNRELGQTHLVEQEIDTGDAIPIHQPPYRVSHSEREIIREQVRDMLETEIIRPSFSPWCSPVVLVRKKSGEWRFCVDYRKLNSVLKWDAYPLPVIDDILTYFEGARFLPR